MLTMIQLEQLARMPSPLVTLYVVTSLVETPSRGPAAAYLPWLKDQSRTVAEGLSSAEQEIFLKQVERIREFLCQRTPEERSLVIFAGPSVWQVVALQSRVENELYWGNPALSQLIWLASEHRPYGFVVVDHAGARFFHYWLSEIVEHEEKQFNIDVSQWKKKELGHVTGQGVEKTRGSQRDLFQSRLESRYAQLCRETAQQVAAFCARFHLAAIFLVGPDRLIKPIEAKLPRNCRQPIVLFNQDLARLAPVELLRHLEPQVAQWEHKRETELVAAVSSGERAVVVGVDETLAWLQKGKVRTLIVAQKLDAILHQCGQCGWTDRSADPICPVCGSQRRAVTLRDVLPGLARKHQAEIEVVGDEAAEALSKVGGMAAWLRELKRTARSGD